MLTSSTLKERVTPDGFTNVLNYMVTHRVFIQPLLTSLLIRNEPCRFGELITRSYELLWNLNCFRYQTNSTRSWMLSLVTVLGISSFPIRKTLQSSQQELPSYDKFFTKKMKKNSLFLIKTSKLHKK